MYQRLRVGITLGLLFLYGTSAAWGQGGNTLMNVTPYGEMYSFGSILVAAPGTSIYHGPVLSSDPSVNMDQFILTYGSAVSMGNTDARNQNDPSANLAFAVTPSAATALIGIPSSTTKVNGHLYGRAGSYGNISCRKVEGGGATSWQCANDATGFTTLYTVSSATGSGTVRVYVLSIWKTLPTLNFNVFFNDPTLFPPGYSISGAMPYTVPGYMTSTPSGNVYVPIAAPLASVVASYGCPNDWATTGHYISSEVRSYSDGLAPVYLGFDETMMVIGNYTTNSSVMTSTTIMDWHADCPAGGCIPGQIVNTCPPPGGGGGTPGGGSPGGSGGSGSGSSGN